MTRSDQGRGREQSREVTVRSRNARGVHAEDFLRATSARAERMQAQLESRRQLEDVARAERITAFAESRHAHGESPRRRVMDAGPGARAPRPAVVQPPHRFDP